MPIAIGIPSLPSIRHSRLYERHSTAPLLARAGYHARMTAMRASVVTGWDRRHLLGLEGLTRDDVLMVLDAAERFRSAASGSLTQDWPRTLEGRTLANLFFEDSTRTRISFTIAAQRLGAHTVEITPAGSSLSKGETLLDTALNIQAMGVHGLVVRAAASGAAAMVAQACTIPVINAGDGQHEHPTQGLLDLLTLRQYLDDLAGRTIAIVGDIVSSRVARSALWGLTTLGANVILVGPPAWVPRTFEQLVPPSTGVGRVAITNDFDAVLESVDAIMMLRVQFERRGAAPPGPGSQPGTHAAAGANQVLPPDYRDRYALTAERASRMKPGTLIMHPGPINRGLEIDSDVADDPDRSVILQQVTNGVAVRMAVLELLLAHPAIE